MILLSYFIWNYYRKSNLKNQEFYQVKQRIKWLVFALIHYYQSINTEKGLLDSECTTQKKIEMIQVTNDYHLLNGND